MLPARFVAEALGAEVSWNDEKREVTIEKGELKIVIAIDSDKAFIGEEEVTSERLEAKNFATGENESLTGFATENPKADPSDFWAD